MTSVAERQQIAGRLTDAGLVAVVRHSDQQAAAWAIDALIAGGVRAIEVTMTTPGALELIEQCVVARHPDVLVGVGSVTDATTARAAIGAGARFVVSPVFAPDVLYEAHQHGVPTMLGAFTPTEALAVHSAGSDFVKVFPAEVLTAAFIKGVLAPMPFLKLVPTGGVTLVNIGDWFRAGVVAVGVGGALMAAAMIAHRDLDGLTTRAREFVRALHDARSAIRTPRTPRTGAA